jgi:hypothetical protein
LNVQVLKPKDKEKEKERSNYTKDSKEGKDQKERLKEGGHEAPAAPIINKEA